MNNDKKELIKQANKLQKELDILKEQINKPFDVFSFTTYKEVIQELEEDSETCPYKKIKQIEKFFNEEWTPTWKNQNEYKYYPYFYIGSDGGLVYHTYLYYGSGFDGGCAFYKTKELAIHVGKNFLKEYKDLMNNY